MSFPMMDYHEIPVLAGQIGGATPFDISLHGRVFKSVGLQVAR